MAPLGSGAKLSHNAGMTKVAVIAGGKSQEAAVSRVSARGVSQALQEKGYEVTVEELDAQLGIRLIQGNYDVVFPVAHGSLGEDGCLQGLLEILELPYIGCEVLASSIAAHKPTTKRFFAAASLPIAQDRVVNRGDDIALAAQDIRTIFREAALKPASGGSALSLFHMTESSTIPEIIAKLEELLEADRSILVESWLEGKELTCGVLERGSDCVALPPVLILPTSSEFYDYQAKYAAGGSKHLCPAPLSPEIENQVKSLALKAHQTIGARDMSRTDFIFNEKTQSLHLLEINTLPGMTPTSLFPEEAQAYGIAFPDLCAELVERAIKRGIRNYGIQPELPS